MRKTMTKVCSGTADAWCPLCCHTVGMYEDSAGRILSYCPNCGDAVDITAHRADGPCCEQVADWMRTYRHIIFAQCAQMARASVGDIYLHCRMADRMLCPVCDAPMFYMHSMYFPDCTALWFLVCPTCPGKTPEHDRLPHLVLPIGHAVTASEAMDTWPMKDMAKYYKLYTHLSFA